MRVTMGKCTNELGHKPDERFEKLLGCCDGKGKGIEQIRSNPINGSITDHEAHGHKHICVYCGEMYVEVINQPIFEGLGKTEQDAMLTRLSRTDLKTIK